MDARLVDKKVIDERSNWRGVNSEDAMLSYFPDKKMAAALRIDEYLLKDEAGYWLHIKHYGARTKDSSISRISTEEAKDFVLGELDEEVYNEPHYEILFEEFGIDLRPVVESTPTEPKPTMIFAKEALVGYTDFKINTQILAKVDNGDFYVLVNGRSMDVIGVLMSAENYEKYGFNLPLVDFQAREIVRTWRLLKSTIDGYNGEKAICFRDRRTTDEKIVRYIVSLEKFKEKFDVNFL